MNSNSESKTTTSKMRLDGTPTTNMKRTKEDRRRKNALGSRCSRCNEAVWMTGHKALNRFLNEGRICDSCKAKAVDPTFEQVKQFLVDHYKHERLYGGTGDYGRGIVYGDCVVESHRKLLTDYGFACISKYESRTGDVIWHRFINGSFEILDSAAVNDSRDTQREEMLLGKGREYLGPIRAKLAIHGATDDSDATLETILGNCVGRVWLIPAAKLLRDAGETLVEHGG